VSKRSTQDPVSAAKERAAPVLIRILEFLDGSGLPLAERIIVAQALVRMQANEATAAGANIADMLAVTQVGEQLAREIVKVPIKGAKPAEQCHCGVYGGDVEFPKSLRDKAGREARKALKRIVNDS
jgi:hypothetical protein